MAVTCNITSTFGATTPTGGFTNQSQEDATIEKFRVYDEDGDVVRLRGGKLITKPIQISGKGSADYAAVVAGDFTIDTFKAISAETTEHETGEHIDFSISGKMFSNVA